MEHLFKKPSLILLGFLSFWLTLAGLKLPQIQADGAGFAVSAVIPSNQYNQNASYFDLKMKPNQVEQVQIQVQNLTNQEKYLTAYPNTGYTSDAGVEAYNRHQLGRRSQATYLFSDIISQPQKIVLAPQQSKKITFTIQMPAQNYHGILEGAFYFLDTKSSNGQTTNQKGMTIKNRYALALGVVLREDTTTKVAPKMTLNKITAGIQDTANFSVATKVNLANTRPTLIHNLKIVGQISKTKHSKVLYQTKNTGLGMAPNSNFNYSIDWQNKAMKSGKYHLHLVATAQKHHWVFDRDFTITQHEADRVNKHANVEHNWTWLWIILGILLLILLLIAVYLIGRRTGHKKETPKPADSDKKTTK